LVASLLPREVEASIDGQVVHQHQGRARCGHRNP
jgi:hypothetical protein